MKKIFILALLASLVLIFTGLSPIITKEEVEEKKQIDINDYRINYSIDKNIYQPLETAVIKIESEKEILPITLKIIKKGDPTKVLILKQIDNSPSEIPIVIGD